MDGIANQIEERNWHRSVYEQLHQIAERALQCETPGHSLQPTLLVNDAYLRLLEQRNVNPEDRSAVFAAGANIIRRLLVDYARKRKALKRGGEKGRGNGLHLSIVGNANVLDVLELQRTAFGDVDRALLHQSRSRVEHRMTYGNGVQTASNTQPSRP